MTTTATSPDRFTITFSRSGQGAGHAARANQLGNPGFPLCGANMNHVRATAQVQARDWSKVTCKRCLSIIALNDTGN